MKKKGPDAFSVGVVFLFLSAGVPLLVWFLTSLIIPEALIEGPFLYMSPVIAITTLMLVVGLRDSRPKNLSVSDPTLELEFNTIRQKLGSPQVKVYSQPDDGRSHRWPFTVLGDMVLVYIHEWNEWDARVRKHMMAFLLALEADENAMMKSTLLAAGVATVAGCFLASLNLWLILPLHAFVLLGAYSFASSFMRRRVILADARALRITMDYRAAQSFAKWHGAPLRIFGKRFANARGEALAAEAVKLQLITVNTGS